MCVVSYNKIIQNIRARYAGTTSVGIVFIIMAVAIPYGWLRDGLANELAAALPDGGHHGSDGGGTECESAMMNRIYTTIIIDDADSCILFSDS